MNFNENSDEFFIISGGSGKDRFLYRSALLLKLGIATLLAAFY
jgi:hypothetical protein